MRPLPTTYHDTLLATRRQFTEDCAALADRIRESGWNGKALPPADFESLLLPVLHHECDRALEKVWKHHPALKTRSRSEAMAFLAKMPQTERLYHQLAIDASNLVNLELFGWKTYFLSQNLTEQIPDGPLHLMVDDVTLRDRAMVMVLEDDVVMKAAAAGTGDLHPEAILQVYLYEFYRQKRRCLMVTAVISIPKNPTHLWVKREIPMPAGASVEAALAANGEVHHEEGHDDKLMLPFYRMIMSLLMYLKVPAADISPEIRPGFPRHPYHEVGAGLQPG
jgi:hypothetical protein